MRNSVVYEDNEISIKKIILEKLKGFEGLTTENINLILNHTNLDRSKLNNELEKIIMFCKQNHLITS